MIYTLLFMLGWGGFFPIILKAAVVFAVVGNVWHLVRPSDFAASGRGLVRQSNEKAHPSKVLK